MKYLFIGGRCDGRRFEIADHLPLHICVPVMPAPPWADIDTFSNPYSSCDSEKYHRRVFSIAGVDFAVYTHGWMDLAIIMQQLLEGYGAKNKT